jgi:hypothetical protein
MLRLGVVGPRRGVDDLIDRLRTTDGWAWWENCMSELGEGSAPEAAKRLVEGQATLDFMAKSKERYKGTMGAGNPAAMRLASMAAYYVCVSAALVHHKKAITGQDSDLLSEALADLAASIPEPWSGMVGKAAMAVPRKPGKPGKK